MKRWQWYARWHGWNYHRHVHALLLGLYVFAIGVVFVGLYQKTQALSDLTNSWNFSNAADYSLAGGVEASGSSARLKAQNYTTDANTVALYHFDAASGTTVTDSSGNNNNGTASNAIYGSGNLNNALGFNGTTSGCGCLHRPRLI